jgi:hypothetical protein
MGPCNPFKGFIELVAEGRGCIQAETEESVLVLEIKLGIVLEIEETVLRRNKNDDDGLDRRTIKGNFLRIEPSSSFFGQDLMGLKKSINRLKIRMA